MSYISKQFDEFILPDGKIASSARDVDAYLRRSGLAMAGDYSQGFLQQKQAAAQSAMRQDLFASFIQQYQRKFWNEK